MDRKNSNPVGTLQYMSPEQTGRTGKCLFAATLFIIYFYHFYHIYIVFVFPLISFWTLRPVCYRASFTLLKFALFSSLSAFCIEHRYYARLSHGSIQSGGGAVSSQHRAAAVWTCVRQRAHTRDYLHTLTCTTRAKHRAANTFIRYHCAFVAKGTLAAISIRLWAVARFTRVLRRVRAHTNRCAVHASATR